MALNIGQLINKLQTVNPAKKLIQCYHLDNNRRVEERNSVVIRANMTDEVLYELFVDDDGKIVGTASMFDMIQNLETYPMSIEEAKLLITDLTEDEISRLTINLRK